jgi:hypothetical protein
MSRMRISGRSSKTTADILADGERARAVAHRPGPSTPLKVPEPKTVQGKAVLDAFMASTQSTRDQLAILRQTRGQREVGALIVPPHLRTPDVVRLSARGALDPRACQTCGRGLPAGESGPSCGRCINDPNAEAGIEHRTSAAAVLPARG